MAVRLLTRYRWTDLANFGREIFVKLQGELKRFIPLEKRKRSKLVNENESFFLIFNYEWSIINIVLY